MSIGEKRLKRGEERRLRLHSGSSRRMLLARSLHEHVHPIFPVYLLPMRLSLPLMRMQTIGLPRSDGAYIKLCIGTEFFIIKPKYDTTFQC